MSWRGHCAVLFVNLCPGVPCFLFRVGSWCASGQRACTNTLPTHPQGDLKHTPARGEDPLCRELAARIPSLTTLTAQREETSVYTKPPWHVSVASWWLVPPLTVCEQ